MNRPRSFTGPGALSLPQLQGRPIVTDGGLETDLIVHHGSDPPHFAAFPLLDSGRGRALLASRITGVAPGIAAEAAG